LGSRDCFTLTGSPGRQRNKAWASLGWERSARHGPGTILRSGATVKLGYPLSGWESKGKWGGGGPSIGGKTQLDLGRGGKRTKGSMSFKNRPYRRYTGIKGGKKKAARAAK